MDGFLDLATWSNKCRNVLKPGPLASIQMSNLLKVCLGTTQTCYGGKMRES